MDNGMECDGDEHQELAVKDPDSERPIPMAWRGTIKAIVQILAQSDIQSNAGLTGVRPVSAETAQQIQKYLESYGAELVELPEETWQSSVCIWTGSGWDALIDLWTAAEGRSDLVLSLQVTESQDGFEFGINMVYVP